MDKRRIESFVLTRDRPNVQGVEDLGVKRVCKKWKRLRISLKDPYHMHVVGLVCGSIDQCLNYVKLKKKSSKLPKQ